MVRLLIIFFLLLAGGLIFSCKKRIDSIENNIDTKVNTFRIYNEALDRCKKLSVDSILICTQDYIDLDTISKVEQPIWREYGRAKAHFHNNLGAEAFDIINQVLPETENYQLLYERAELLELRSILYRNNYRMQFAAEDMYQAADIYQQLNLKQKAASLFSEIAALQYNVANFELTNEIGNQALFIYEQISPLRHEDSIRLMQLYNTLALGLYKQEKYDMAKKNFLISYSIAEALGQEFWMGLVKGNMADILIKEGNLKEGIENYKFDIKTSLKYHEPTSAALSLLRLGDISLSHNELKKAKYYYDSAYVLIQQSGRPVSFSSYHRAISKWYERVNQPEDALVHFKKYLHLRDSIQNIEISSQIQRIRNQKEVEKQLADINLLKAENELRVKELAVSRISISAFIVIFILLLVLLYTIRRNNKQLNELNLSLENKVKARTERLRKINDELETYLYRASHDVRRPILTILGLIKIADITDERERTFIRQSIKKTANEMDRMLKKLQMAYELEKQKRKRKERINLNEYLKDKIEFFRKEYPLLIFDLIEDTKINTRANVVFIDTVFLNILENACNFTLKEDGKVIVRIDKDMDYASISVKDNGEGIDHAYHDKIFEPYKRYSNKSTGSGLGLYLVQKAIKNMKGKVIVKSHLNEGAEFIVTIPLMTD